MTIVTVQIGGDYRSLHRHYYRKRKDDLASAVQNLQRMVGDSPSIYAALKLHTKDELADMCCKLHKRLPE